MTLRITCESVGYPAIEAPTPLPVVRKALRGSPPSARRGPSAPAGSVDRKVIAGEPSCQLFRLCSAVADSRCGAAELPTAAFDRTTAGEFGRSKPVPPLRYAVLLVSSAAASPPSSVKPPPALSQAASCRNRCAAAVSLPAGAKPLRPFRNGLLPPQPEQPPVGVVQTAGRLGQLAALIGHDDLGGGALGEVAGRVGHLGRRLGHPALPGRPAGAQVELDLPVRDGDQPRAETVRLAQAGQAADRAQHGVLHQIVHIGMTGQDPADDVVDQREVLGDEIVEGVGVTGLGGPDEPGDPRRDLALGHRPSSPVGLSATVAQP